MGVAGLAMPLLSTLAALVIIVHSAEENYEREYRVLRPRSLDVETPNNDQAWRMVEMDPEMTQSSHITEGSTWDETNAEQSVRHRRPVRKRKRRPQLPVDEDPIQQERYTYNEDSRPLLQENIDRPRRRRKKIDYQDSNSENRQSGWNEEISNRPKRRRGHKRKRPLAESWPELSEFNGYQQPERTENSEEPADSKEIRNDSTNGDDDNNHNDLNEKIDSKVQIHNEYDSEIETTTQTLVIDFRNYPQIIKKDEDRSLSEFSMESMKKNEKSNIAEIPTAKIRDKTTITFNDIEQPKEKEPLDPFTLKALLKRSNGKSLSEILQQNNLSLADLLHGREKALSILKNESLPIGQNTGKTKNSNTIYNDPGHFIENVESLNKKEFIETVKYEEENKNIDIETTTTFFSTTEHISFDYRGNNKNNGHEEFDNNGHKEDNNESNRRASLRRRFPGGIRRRLRTRPTLNNTYKSQLSRDLIALSSMKYKNNRNLSKSREWKEIIPSLIRTESPTVQSTIQVEPETGVLSTTPCALVDTTTDEIYETTTDPSYASTDTESTAITQDEQDYANSKSSYLKTEKIDTENFTTIPVVSNTEPDKEIVTEKPKYSPIVKTVVNASDLRRQAFTNRLKRKRMKQRTSTTETPEELELNETFGIGKFVSASDFTTKTQTRTTKVEDEDDFTTLEDYLTTESSQRSVNRQRTKKPRKNNSSTSFTIQRPYVTTEETAKFEIDEILNDDHTSAKLSKILQERNMTLKELVEHRERGSSHVHLADIFHNASKEPNPPEPFLSKSLIEPISKETYPLRALLEANLHDPKTTTIEPNLPQTGNLNIPVIMDFGNNVNENGENMGIMSLFKNNNKTNSDITKSNGESNRSYDSVDVKDNIDRQGIPRDSRMLDIENESVTWNDIITLVQNKHQSENIEIEKQSDSVSPTSKSLKITLDEDVDGDGLIVLDDIEHLRNFDSDTSSDDLLELKLYEKKSQQTSNTSNSIANNTRSVTVATASIIGLALILFLLTYAVLKWKQQSKVYQSKHGNDDEFVPTPVFENRKGHKINSSTRSKSPMLASSNIYSIDTIDTHVGSESPEYMWDTLRKPYQ